MSCPSEKFNLQLSLATLTATLALAFLLIVLATPVAHAQTQTFRVVHDFTAGLDGAVPYASLTIDEAGNLYGTSYYGGGGTCNDGFGIGCGTVFQLTHGRLGWKFNPLYEFTGKSDGAYPAGSVIFGPDGTLYGTTSGGVGFGIIFNLRPSGAPCVSALCPWTVSVLYSFTKSSFGEFPFFGDLVFDQAGNLYGTTIEGGSNDQGVVYELSPSASGWTQNILYNMEAQASGYFPYSGVIFDNAGNLYGTASMGGAYNYGAVYQLTPSAAGWTENTVYSFQNDGDGSVPIGGLIVDQSGNLYGTTAAVPGATVFELTPSDGKWTFNVLYSFSANPNQGPDDGPNDGLLMDAAGNFYGTAYGEGMYSRGSVFKLTASGGHWSYTDLHDFSGSDGEYPIGGVVQDANGNIYGTTSGGGAYGYGVVFEITP
jgi:uncharacterized repeat protein (TIGR03803 family)